MFDSNLIQNDFFYQTRASNNKSNPPSLACFTTLLCLILSEFGCRIFIFIYIFPLNFAKIYGQQNFLQNYTSSVVEDGGRDLLPCPHSVTYPRGTVAPATAVGHDGRGPVCFKKIVFFCLNSDGAKLYMKVVAFDEI
jgi:hypothetical protein